MKYLVMASAAVMFGWLTIPAVEQALIIAATLLFPPILISIALITLLAVFGKSLGLRKAYIELLLKVFEWGREKIKEVKSRSGPTTPSNDTASEGSELSSDEGTLTKRRHTSGEPIIIKREGSKRIGEKLTEPPMGTRVWTMVDDSLDFMKAGVESIIEDLVTSRFRAEELGSWNLLTRTSGGFQYYGIRMTILWIGGFLFRYVVLLPIRFIFLGMGLTWLVVCTAIIGYMPNGERKRRMNRAVSLIIYRILSRMCSAIVTSHDVENMAQSDGICVANHTSPIDVMILSSENCYALVGQTHPGMIGLIQRALQRASHHLWFERTESKDRETVAKRLREHVDDPTKLPVLIFPEGTCINNTSVMMFKKGSFEASDKIYPVAIKYDPRFGDPFWNSSRETWMEYLVNMMTSWAIVCDVWYLPPMTREPNESAIDFAGRVRKVIAEKGGLVDLDWDGQLKRFPVPAKMIEEQKRLYSLRLGKTTSFQQERLSEEEIERIVQKAKHADLLEEDEDEVEDKVADEVAAQVAEEVADKLYGEGGMSGEVDGLHDDRLSPGAMRNAFANGHIKTSETHLLTADQ